MKNNVSVGYGGGVNFENCCHVFIFLHFRSFTFLYVCPQKMVSHIKSERSGQTILTRKTTMSREKKLPNNLPLKHFAFLKMKFGSFLHWFRVKKKLTTLTCKGCGDKNQQFPNMMTFHTLPTLMALVVHATFVL